MKSLNCQPLKKWFLAHRRDLPWRENVGDPYAVWVSEVMLQQTQVSVVIPYYLRWMNRFPTIEALAKANIEEVIKYWEGLGYYSRARNLHEGARYLVLHENGFLPSDESALSKIKGLGPYTIGAILSFAFHQKKAAVDGNVMRVISRLFELEEDITKASTGKKIRQIVESILPDNESWIISEALIELGATICHRTPQCRKCPMQQQCAAHKNGRTKELPIKSKGPQTIRLYRSVVLVCYESYFMVKKGKKGEIMEDLYEFPFFEREKDEHCIGSTLQMIEESYSLKPKTSQPLNKVTHSFTRFQVELNPLLVEVESIKKVVNYEWRTLSELYQLPFSSGHRKLLQSL